MKHIYVRNIWVDIVNYLYSAGWCRYKTVYGHISELCFRYGVTFFMVFTYKYFSLMPGRLVFGIL